MKTKYRREYEVIRSGSIEGILEEFRRYVDTNDVFDAKIIALIKEEKFDEYSDFRYVHYVALCEFVYEIVEYDYSGDVDVR